MLKRTLCIATIFYMIGIIIGLYLEISIVFLFLIFMISAILLYRFSHKKIYIVFILMICIGAIYVKMIDLNYESKYQFIREEEEYRIEAIVVSDVSEKEYKEVYQIEIKSINGNKEYGNIKCLLNLKKSKNTNKKISHLEYGDVIRFYGSFEIPSSARNYMGFDYKQYLKSKNIYANISTKDEITIVKSNQINIIGKSLYYIAKDIKNRLYQLLPKEARELCIGVLIGERSDISEQINIAFKNSNLTHILAVSGAHISCIILGLSFLLAKSGKRFQKIFTIVFLIFFMGLTKFTPSVERASIMSILTLLASLMHRKSDVYQNLTISAMIILLLNPYSILDIGFQLSYGGTIGIIVFHQKISKFLYQRLKRKECLKEEILKRNEIQDKIRDIVKKSLKYVLDMFIVTVSANLVIVPIMIFQFNTLSLTFWISNILAGPFIGFITILGFIVYLVSVISMNLASLLAFPLSILLKILIYIANFCSQLPFSNITIKTPYIIQIIIYYFGITCLFYFNEMKKWIQSRFQIKTFFKKILLITCISEKRYFYKSWIILIISLVIIIYIIAININQSLKIYFIDVGQGDCTLIRTPTNKVILIDGGGSENSSFDVGKQTLLPYLLDRRITKIDYMMISHFDTDHVGGLLYLLENMKVKNLIISKQGKICENYKRFKEIVKNKQINILIGKQGEKIKIDKNCYFDILFPTNELIEENILNNNSIVAKFYYHHFSILFTGDIEEVAEKQLIEIYKDSNLLRVDILKVAHHGSKSSSIQEILEKIQPKMALIGVGSKNTFGHPNDGVIKRLENLGTRIYRTDENGEIELKVTRKGEVKIRKKFKNKK